MPTRKNKDITRIVNRVNKSSADFVNRLKDPNRLTIPDWEDSRYIATHKLGVGTDDNGQVFIFPYVQNIDGKLIDFSNPKFGKWDGMDSAIERKDTVHVDNIQDGLDFTENYKRYYPKSKSFKYGGRRKARLGLEEEIPTQEEYIAQQIAAKKAAALDKSRNRTSVKVPMVPNDESEEVWKRTIDDIIRMDEELLSRMMNELGKSSNPYDISRIEKTQKRLDKLLEEKDAGYPKLVPGANCMYNAGDCYGLNIPGNQTFVAKHKELGFKKASKGSMEPGDIVQDVRSGTPIHAMIYDSKDAEGNLLFNYARGNVYSDFENSYVKQGKYSLPIKDYDVYKYVGTPTDSTQWINEYKQRYGNQMKCGGRRKAQLGLDIREGGIAIPIAPNMYYMKGRSHDDGGIAIGPNNKNGLEVEGGEVVKVGKNDVKVFSSVPLLRGVSPAQLVMGGANPNVVFNAQEEFKDRNRINDDGTTYETGGQKTININDMPSVFRGQKINGRYIQLGIPPATNKANKLDINFKQRLSSLNDDMKDFIMDGIKYGQQILPKSLRKYYAKGINILNSPGVHDISNAAQKITQVEAILDKKKVGGIYIKPNKRGTFTAAATKHGMGVQEFASKVLANKEDYSPAMVKKANFARNASHWKKEFGGNMIYEINGNIKNGLMSLRPKAQYGKEKKINNDIKIGDDNLIYKRGIDGNWYTDGTTYEKSKYYMREKSVLSGGKRSDGTVVKPKTKSQSLPELVVTGQKPTKTIHNVDGTFDNARPQFYAEKRIGLYGDKSLAEKFGLARSGWSFGENPKFNYVPNINIGIPNNYKTKVSSDSKNIAGSTPRKGRTQSKTNSLAVNSPTITSKLKSGNSTYDVSRLGSPKSKVAKAKLNTPSTGSGTQAKDGRWVGQYKTTNAGDWIGLGSNVLGSLASYFITKNAINKMPDPVKPVMAQAAKLKTKYNIEPQLTNVREAEQMNRAAVRRNTASSNTSLAREQRLVNESRGTRNQLYGQKENIETQLINQDRLNRQSVRMDNVRTYNNYLNRLIGTRQTQNQLGISNINNLIYGLTGSVNNIIGNIESRKATNNTIRAIAAANPNVDARLIGGFDYYIDPITKKKYNKNQQYVGTINS